MTGQVTAVRWWRRARRSRLTLTLNLNLTQNLTPTPALPLTQGDEVEPTEEELIALGVIKNLDTGEVSSG